MTPRTIEDIVLVRHIYVPSQLCDNDLPSKKLKCPYDRKFNGPFWNNRRYGCWDAGKRHKLCDKCCRRDRCPVCNAAPASKVIPEREPETVS